MERKPRRLCRLSSSPFFSFCSSRAKASITPPARWITSRPCAVIGSTSITPVPRATATSICSVNSRFPLDFERKISYTKSVISRRCGGIGRRPGFKIPCSQERAGSTPATENPVPSTAPNQYNPNQIFQIGNGFGFFIDLRYNFFLNGKEQKSTSKPRIRN